MFNHFFDGFEVNPDYSKEYISLWEGWLGIERMHLLDEVTENDWARFNEMLRKIALDFCIKKVNFENHSLTPVNDIESVISTYDESMNKDASCFIGLVIPDLECVITEEWDYTYIIWHKNNGALKALIPYINQVGLEHFTD